MFSFSIIGYPRLFGGIWIRLFASGDEVWQKKRKKNWDRVDWGGISGWLTWRGRWYWLPQLPICLIWYIGSGKRRGERWIDFYSIAASFAIGTDIQQCANWKMPGSLFCKPRFWFVENLQTIGENFCSPNFGNLAACACNGAFSDKKKLCADEGEACDNANLPSSLSFKFIYPALIFILVWGGCLEYQEVSQTFSPLPSPPLSIWMP